MSRKKSGGEFRFNLDFSLLSERVWDDKQVPAVIEACKTLVDPIRQRKKIIFDPFRVLPSSSNDLPIPPRSRTRFATTLVLNTALKTALEITGFREQCKVLVYTPYHKDPRYYRSSTTVTVSIFDSGVGNEWSNLKEVHAYGDGNIHHGRDIFDPVQFPKLKHFTWNKFPASKHQRGDVCDFNYHPNNRLVSLTLDKINLDHLQQGLAALPVLRAFSAKISHRHNQNGPYPLSHPSLTDFKLIPWDLSFLMPLLHLDLPKLESLDSSNFDIRLQGTTGTKLSQLFTGYDSRQTLWTFIKDWHHIFQVCQDLRRLHFQYCDGTTNMLLHDRVPKGKEARIKHQKEFEVKLRQVGDAFLKAIGVPATVEYFRVRGQSSQSDGNLEFPYGLVEYTKDQLKAPAPATSNNGPVVWWKVSPLLPPRQPAHKTPFSRPPVLEVQKPQGHAFVPAKALDQSKVITFGWGRRSPLVIGPFRTWAKDEPVEELSTTLVRVDKKGQKAIRGERWSPPTPQQRDTIIATILTNLVDSVKGMKKPVTIDVFDSYYKKSGMEENIHRARILRGVLETAPWVVDHADALVLGAGKEEEQVIQSNRWSKLRTLFICSGYGSKPSPLNAKMLPELRTLIVRRGSDYLWSDDLIKGVLPQLTHLRLTVPLQEMAIKEILQDGTGLREFYIQIDHRTKVCTVKHQKLRVLGVNGDYDKLRLNCPQLVELRIPGWRNPILFKGTSGHNVRSIRHLWNVQGVERNRMTYDLTDTKLRNLLKQVPRLEMLQLWENKPPWVGAALKPDLAITPRLHVVAGDEETSKWLETERMPKAIAHLKEQDEEMEELDEEWDDYSDGEWEEPPAEEEPKPYQPNDTSNDNYYWSE